MTPNTQKDWRTCTTCKENYPLVEEYWYHDYTADPEGWSKQCKPCKKITDKNYREKLRLKGQPKTSQPKSKPQPQTAHLQIGQISITITLPQ